MSTFFEQELRKIIDTTTVEDCTDYIGGVAFIKLSPNQNIRVAFKELNIANLFEAIQFSLINKDKGILDTIILKFKDVVENEKGHIFFDGKNYEWCFWKPSSSDYAKFGQILQKYIDLWNQTPTQKPKNLPIFKELVDNAELISNYYEFNVNLGNFALSETEIEQVWNFTNTIVEKNTELSKAYNFDTISYALMAFLSENEMEDLIDSLFPTPEAKLTRTVDYDFVREITTLYNDLETTYEI